MKKGCLFTILGLTGFAGLLLILFVGWALSLPARPTASKREPSPHPAVAAKPQANAIEAKIESGAGGSAQAKTAAPLAPPQPAAKPSEVAKEDAAAQRQSDQDFAISAFKARQ